MTFGELKMMVSTTDKKRVPTARFLAEYDAEVIHTEPGRQPKITVYRSGYFVYSNGTRATVGSIARCGSYTYDFIDGGAACLTENELNDLEWSVRLTMEGEDRIAGNMERLSAQHSQSWDAMAYEPAGIGPQQDMMEGLLREEFHQAFAQAYSTLCPQQKKLLRQVCVDHLSYAEIARREGVNPKTVWERFHRIQEKLKKYLQ